LRCRVFEDFSLCEIYDYLGSDAGRPFQTSFHLYLQEHPDLHHRLYHACQHHHDPRFSLDLASKPGSTFTSDGGDIISHLALSYVTSSNEVDPHSMNASVLAPITTDEPGCSEHDGIGPSLPTPDISGRSPIQPSPLPVVPAEVDYVLLRMDTLKLSTSSPSNPGNTLLTDAAPCIPHPDAAQLEEAKLTLDLAPPTSATRNISRKAESPEAIPALLGPEASKTPPKRASVSPRPPRSKPLLSYKPTVNNSVGNGGKVTRPRPIGILKSVRRHDDQACDDPGAEGDKETDGHDVQMTVAGARRRTRRRRSLAKDASQCPEDVKMKERGRGSNLKKVRKRVHAKQVGGLELQNAQMAHKKARARRGRSCASKIGDDVHPEAKLTPMQRIVALESM